MNRQIFKTNRSMLLFHFIFKCIKHTRQVNMLTQEHCFNRDRCSTPRMNKNNNNSNNNNNMIMACWVDIYPHKVWVLYFWSRSSFFSGSFSLVLYLVFSVSSPPLSLSLSLYHTLYCSSFLPSRPLSFAFS